ncbi:MAG: DUF2497 domain-containing protein [Proteobacteria bacterium]|nr:DUF2497 domain-containing protein [Pseudomonadota bacterium]
MIDKYVPGKEITAHDLERAMAEMQKVLDNPPNMDILDLTEEIDDDGVDGSLEGPGLAALRRQRAALHAALAQDDDKSEQAAHESNYRQKHSTQPKIGLLDVDIAVESQEAIQQLLNMKKPNKQQVSHRSDLEELVMEILKPQLGQWLNKHLPQIVQSVVEREIKKLIPDDTL